jgi:hypothetical protein
MGVASAPPSRESGLTSMDTCAELTLRILRLSQEALNPLSSMVGWCFLPEHRRTTWSDARDILSASPKPLLVAPLVEPGYLVVWSLESVSSRERGVWEREFANQCEYFSEKLESLGLADADSVTLAAPEGDFRISVADFRRWPKEYAIPVGISLTKSSATHTARILVRPPGGGRPLGLEPPSEHG